MFRYLLRGENKPEAEMGKLGGCDEGRKYNRGRGWDGSDGQSTARASGTQIWGAAVLLSRRRRNLDEGQKSGKDKLSIQRAGQNR